MLKKIGITQPHYIPYIGYFSLIKNVDIFVMLDNVKYIKQEWKNRNKIRFDPYTNKTRWLTISINKINENFLIKDIKISNAENIIYDHLKLIKNSYLKSPFFEDIFIIYNKIINNLQNKDLDLGQINFLFIEEICSYLEIDTLIKFSSNIIENKMKDKNTYTLEIIEKCDADIYIANNKSFEYLNVEKFNKNKITCIKQNYDYPNYLQSYRRKDLKFISNLSIVDTICNIGKETKYLI